MEGTKIYYSMREVCEQTGLPIPTIRYWESQFEGLSPRRDQHGNRYFTLEEIELIKRIKYIRDEMKITRIEAIKNELASSERKSDVRQRATDILLRIRQELVDIRTSL